MRAVLSIAQRAGLAASLCLLAGCPTTETTPAAGANESSSPDLEARRTRCAKAIEHVTLGIYPEFARPKDAEATVIEELGKKATEVCVKEGFEQKQADCMMAGTMEDQLASVRDCLGDKKDWPSWFSGAGVQLP